MTSKINLTLTDTPAPFDTRVCDTDRTIEQIGPWNLAFISGGRIIRHKDGLSLPVGNGYAVDIRLAPSDLYTVRRVFVRGGKVTVKGTMTDVYADELSWVARDCSCYHNGEVYGSWQPHAVYTWL